MQQRNVDDESIFPGSFAVNATAFFCGFLHCVKKFLRRIPVNHYKCSNVYQLIIILYWHFFIQSIVFLAYQKCVIDL